MRINCLLCLTATVSAAAQLKRYNLDKRSSINWREDIGGRPPNATGSVEIQGFDLEEASDDPPTNGNWTVTAEVYADLPDLRDLLSEEGGTIRDASGTLLKLTPPGNRTSRVNQSAWFYNVNVLELGQEHHGIKGDDEVDEDCKNVLERECIEGLETFSENILPDACPFGNSYLIGSLNDITSQRSIQDTIIPRHAYNEDEDDDDEGELSAEETYDRSIRQIFVVIFSLYEAVDADGAKGRAKNDQGEDIIPSKEAIDVRFKCVRPDKVRDASRAMDKGKDREKSDEEDSVTALDARKSASMTLLVAIAAVVLVL